MRILIEKLTPEQEALIPIVRDEWLAYGLSTEPANRPLAESGAMRAYKEAGLEPPHTIIWCDSPMAGGYCNAAVEEVLKLSDKKPFTESQIKEIQGIAAEAVQKKRRLAYDTSSTYGQFDAGWAGFYDFFRRIGLECCEKLSGLLDISKSSGWWWPYERVVILSERPRRLIQDAQNRLHCDDGMSLLYPDGWGIWAHHGVRVNEQIIMRPHTLDPKEIIQHPNAEIRRVMTERYGLDKLMIELKAEVLDEDTDDQGNNRKLLRLQIAGEAEPTVAAYVACPSTGRTYALRVPPDTTKVGDGVAWTFGVDPKEYRPQFQT